MDEAEARDEHMPDQSELAKSVQPARVAAFPDGQPLIIAGGEVDWPLNVAMSARPQQ